MITRNINQALTFWITGFGFGAASAKEQPMIEVFLALRAQPNPRFPSVGRPARGGYMADAGFTGKDNLRRWKSHYGAIVICEPQAHALAQSVEVVAASLTRSGRVRLR